MKKYRVALVGAGRYGDKHLSFLTQIPQAEVVAVCDADEGRAKDLARKWQIPQPGVFTEYTELVKRTDIDVIDICTPNYLHSIIALVALEAGKHVLTEKPDAMTVTEAERMASTARQRGLTLMSIRNNRFRQSTRLLKEYIEQGGLGEIYTARCGWIRRNRIPGRGGWFTTKSVSGGGPLIDLGVHFIDLTMWLMGNPHPVSVVGNTYCKIADTGEDTTGRFDVEDLANGYIVFENGASLMLEFSWASHIQKEENYVRLLGTKAGAYANMYTNEFRIYTSVDGEPQDIDPDVSHEGGHLEQFLHFFACLDGQEQPIVTPEQGVDMLRILCGLYESAALGGQQIRL